MGRSGVLTEAERARISFVAAAGRGRGDLGERGEGPTGLLEAEGGVGRGGRTVGMRSLRAGDAKKDGLGLGLGFGMESSGVESSGVEGTE